MAETGGAGKKEKQFSGFLEGRILVTTPFIRLLKNKREHIRNGKRRTNDGFVGAG